MKETYQNGDVIEYSYDNGGNLLSKTVNGVVSNSYAYGDTEWKDLLTGFNGTTITYDEIGNPQNWRDGMSFTWVNGRQLGALQKGDLNVSYSYNSDGLRVSKTVNGVKTEYVWDGSSLIGQKTGNNVLVYLYAADGLAGFQYNGVNYYYLKNGQGDVVAILNASGNIVAKYAYDAWGKLLNVTDAAGNDKSADASFIGNINPIRYRSYYYDTETGLYYLQSRYYDPEVGRFVNADGILGANQDILSFNLFAYCSNNPVNKIDPSGYGFFSDLWDEFKNAVKNFIDDYSMVDIPESEIVTAAGYIAISQGWEYRIDPEDRNTLTQKHIHIRRNGEEYSQNIDGSPHDNSKGSPPKWVKKELKRRGKWDWDANETKQMHIELPYPEEFPFYPFFSPQFDVPYYVPSPAPSPAPSPWIPFRPCPAIWYFVVGWCS